MKKNRFVWLGLLSLVLVVGSCQPVSPTPALFSSRTPSPVPATSTPAPTDKPKLEVDMNALKGKKVKILYPWDVDQNRVNQMIEDFNLINIWGIQAVGEAYKSDELLAEAMRQGDLDANIIIGRTYDLLDPQNQVGLLELNLYINDPTWGVMDSYQPDSPFAALAPNANDAAPRYSLPLAYDAGLIYYRTGWAKELGFEAAPTSWDEFVSQMQAGLRANLADDVYVNNGTGGLLLSKSVMSAQSWYAAFGGNYLMQNKVVQMQDSALDASFRALKQAFVADTSWVGLEPTPNQYFTDRFALAYEGLLSEISQQENYLPAKDTELNWETIPYPTADGGGSIALESIGAAINSTNADTDMAAWFCVRWLLQPAQQQNLVELHGLWPATGHPAKVAPRYAALHPAWASALRDGVHLTLAPEDAAWSVNRYVLQDAYMRVYGLEPEYFSSIISVLNQTLAENPAGNP